MATPNPKCVSCRCYWKPDDTDIKTSGICCKTCRKCRKSQKNKRDIIKNEKEKNKCKHEREKKQEFESQICINNERTPVVFW
jgi:hypothetical protein